jgi:biotin carboxylase
MPFVLFAAPLLSDNAFGMIRAAATLPGVELGVITLDADRGLHDLQGRVAHWRVHDIFDVDQLLWAARELSARHGPVHRLFGALEQLQVPLAEARQKLGLDGMSVEAAMNFRDKARMKTLLRSQGIPCARHRLAASVDDAQAFAESSGFPIVVKPPAGAGAQQTFRVETLDQLRGAIALSKPNPESPVLLEEFIVGDEHSFETISIDGQHLWHSMTHYRPTPLAVLENPWIQWALVLPREVDDSRYDDIRTVARRALTALGMTTGLTHMEWFRRRDGSLAISEVAARPPGAQITTMVSRANDIDFVQAWARVMISGEFEPPQRKYAVGAAFLRAQGRGHVKVVQGLDRVHAELGGLICDMKIPQAGSPTSPSYEGEGYIILRHPETKVVEDAVHRVVSLVRVELH